MYMKGLIDKFYNGTCTPEEATLGMNFLLKEEEENEWEENASTGSPYEAEMLTVIQSRTFVKVKRMPWLKMAIAACVLVLCSLSLIRKETAPAQTVSNWVSFHPA